MLLILGAVALPAERRVEAASFERQILSRRADRVDSRMAAVQGRVEFLGRVNPR